MKKRQDPVGEFAQDLYDLMGMNKTHCTQEDFFYKYVEEDHDFMIDEYEDMSIIWFDDYKITIEPR